MEVTTSSEALRCNGPPRAARRPCRPQGYERCAGFETRSVLRGLPGSESARAAGAGKPDDFRRTTTPTTRRPRSSRSGPPTRTRPPAARLSLARPLESARRPTPPYTRRGRPTSDDQTTTFTPSFDSGPAFRGIGVPAASLRPATVVLHTPSSSASRAPIA